MLTSTSFVLMQWCQLFTAVLMYASSAIINYLVQNWDFLTVHLSRSQNNCPKNYVVFWKTVPPPVCNIGHYALFTVHNNSNNQTSDLFRKLSVVFSKLFLTGFNYNYIFYFKLCELEINRYCL